MNRRMVLYRVAQMLFLEAAMLVLPLGVAFLYGEMKQALAFGITIVVSLVAGLPAMTVLKPTSKLIFAKDGFALVTLAWLVMSAFGAAPFVISGEIPNVVDAFFETVSGFTTTGSTILTDVTAMSHSMLFWRSFTHWIGGMGVLVLVMALVPPESGRSIHILRAEMAGPVVGKLVPKIKDTAKILYIIYFVITITEVGFLIAGGMPVFDAFIHSLGTAGTGGFGIKGDSLSSYSPYCQWVIIAFMFIFSINFNLFYLMILRRFKPVLKNLELWVFVGIVFVAAGIISVNIYPLYGDAGEAIRHAFFQTVSICSTTGYSSADFNLWPSMAKSVIFVLLFLGGCAGSTAGGLKISRVILLFKLVRRDIRKMSHPRSVATVKLDGKTVEPAVVSGVSTYFAVYMIVIAITFLLISFEPFGFESNLTAAITCCNNVGPGFGEVGPMNGFAAYSYFSKIVLTFAMLLGRLEFYPVLLAFNPRMWLKK